MDADVLLGRLREHAETVIQSDATGPARHLASQFWLLDRHLCGGRKPPEEWAELPEELSRAFGHFVGLILTKASQAKNGREGEMHAALAAIERAAEDFLDQLDAQVHPENAGVERVLDERVLPPRRPTE